MEEEISLDIKEWMSEVKKPRNLTVQDFMRCLNDLIEYTSIPTIRERKLKNLQMPNWHVSFGTRVLLAGRRVSQVYENLRHLGLAAPTRYYTGLGNIEPNENAFHRKKIQETKTLRQRKGENSDHKIKSDKTLNRNQKYCEIHGKCNHSSSQCDAIQKQREEYKSTSNNKNQEKKNLDCLKHNTRSHTSKKQEQNNSLTTNQKNDMSDAE
jgi:hypothetical protein